MKNFQNVRPMTEGAMLTAITVVLCIAGIYIPVIGSMAKFIWPVPIAILVLRHGLRTGMLATAVSGAILFILTGPINFVVTVLGFGLLGLVLGWCLRKEIGASQVVLWCAVASAISILASLALTIYTTGINPIDLLITSQQEAFDKLLPFMQQMANQPGGAKKLAETKAMMEQMPQMMRMILPSVLVVTSVITSYLNFMVAKWVLVRMGQQVVALPQFRQWRFPSWTAYIYVAGLGMVLFAEKLGMPALYPIGVNMVTAFSYLFLFGGIALLVYIFKEAGISKGMKTAIIILLIVFMSFAFQLLIYAGIFDSIFNYRQIIERKKKNNGYGGEDI